MFKPLGKYAVIGAFLSFVPLTGAQAKDACYDVGKSEPHQLTGMLSYHIFPGPPGYEDVQKGDTPERVAVLRGLALLPEPARFVELAIDSCRSHVQEVFDAVARGLSNTEIAGQVFASESTVKTHVGAILRKLALRDRLHQR